MREKVVAERLAESSIVVRGPLKYVTVKCRLLAHAMYSVFLLPVWLFVRVVRRLKVHARQQRLMYEVRCESLLLKAQPKPLVQVTDLLVRQTAEARIITPQRNCQNLDPRP